MARIKKEEEIKVEDQVKGVVEAIEDIAKITDPEPEIKTETNLTENKTDADLATIPQYVDSKLKMFSNYEELYIDNKGGVYISKDQSSKESILYKNHYHKQ